jgi:hypothetical protein
MVWCVHLCINYVHIGYQPGSARDHYACVHVCMTPEEKYILHASQFQTIEGIFIVWWVDVCFLALSTVSWSPMNNSAKSVHNINYSP